MPGLEFLGGVLNIIQIIGVIQQHVVDSKSVKDVLEEAGLRARRICNSIDQLELLQNTNGVLSRLVGETVEEFNSIEGDLQTIREKVTKRTKLRATASSSGTLAQLKEISARLEQKEQSIKLMGLVGKLIVENGTIANDVRDIRSVLTLLATQLGIQSVGTEPVHALLRQVYQAKCIESTTTLDVSQRRVEGWMKSMDSMDKLAIGISYYKGNEDVPKDFSKAARYLHAARNDGKTEANYYLGMMYRSGWGVHRCNATAFSLFQEGSRAKHPAAMTEYGASFIMGVGTEHNQSLGYAYVKMGAEGGDPRGMHMLSWQKLYGFDQEKNPRLAFQLSQKVVDKGYSLGKANLGDCYMLGLGVERNASKAIELWTESLEGGLDCMAFELGQCYEHGFGVKQDLVKAAQFYKRGANVEKHTWVRPRIQPYYGMCLIRGRGVSQNVKAGWAHIQSSVQANNDSGWFVQGECYRFGYGIEKDAARAVESYKRAISSPDYIEGTVRAYFALGRMYESGEGVQQDYKKAFDHYNFSANNMFRAAQWKVACFCESGAGIERDIVRAVTYYRLAANAGHRVSQIKATKYYLEGKGVQRNLMTASAIIWPAVDKGDREAKRLLAQIEKEGSTITRT